MSFEQMVADPVAAGNRVAAFLGMPEDSFTHEMIYSPDGSLHPSLSTNAADDHVDVMTSNVAQDLAAT